MSNEAKSTTGPFTIRKSMTGADYWYVETPEVQRLALFRREADAKRFAGLIGEALDEAKGAKGARE